MDIFEPLNKGFTVYSKSGCKNCVKVKNLLFEHKIFFLEIQCDEFLLEDKEIFLYFIKGIAKKDCTIFPMVFSDGELIGGFNETSEYVNKLINFNEEF